MDHAKSYAAKGLPPDAYQEVPGEDYPPYVNASDSPPEITVRSVVLGAIFGVLFGSGLVGGEGLLGVGIAAYAVLMTRAPEGVGSGWAGVLEPFFPSSHLGLSFGFYGAPREGDPDVRALFTGSDSSAFRFPQSNTLPRHLSS